jgi:O-acetyl-ADP-ribose deacetylase (regulator of RNase III)
LPELAGAARDDAKDLEARRIGAMVSRTNGRATVRLVRGDITEVEVDAFVFDITEDAKLGSGVGGAIQQRGGVAIQKELDAIGAVPTCEAVVTKAGLLKAQWIIHTNGPKFREPDEEGKLRRALEAVLARAEEKDVKRLAISPIGTGLYQVPIDLCARVTMETVDRHLQNGSGLEEVVLVARDAREWEPFRAAIEKGA